MPNTTSTTTPKRPAKPKKPIAPARRGRKAAKTPAVPADIVAAEQAIGIDPTPAQRANDAAADAELAKIGEIVQDAPEAKPTRAAAARAKKEQKLAGLMDNAKERGFSAKEAAEVKKLRDELGLTNQPAAKPAKPKQPRATGKSALDAVDQVLREATGPMAVKAIAAAVVDRKLAPGLQGKTPHATIGARIYTGCKGEGSRYVKVDTGTVDLRELNPKGAAKRPAKRGQKGGK